MLRFFPLLCRFAVLLFDPQRVSEMRRGLLRGTVLGHQAPNPIRDVPPAGEPPGVHEGVGTQVEYSPFPTLYFVGPDFCIPFHNLVTPKLLIPYTSPFSLLNTPYTYPHILLSYSPLTPPILPFY